MARPPSETFTESWFYAPIDSLGEAIPLPADEAHHAFHVLRLKPGTRAIATPGDGRAFAIRLEGDARAGYAYAESELTEKEEKLVPTLSLALCLLKGRDLEVPVEAVTELPLREIFLIRSAHSQVFDAQDHSKLLSRLRAKSVVSLKQAKKTFLTEIHAPQRFDEFMAQQAERDVIAALPGHDILPPASQVRAPILLIGPEGGFSSEELATLAARSEPYQLSLGPTRLRAIHAPSIALGKMMGLGF